MLKIKTGYKTTIEYGGISAGDLMVKLMSSNIMLNKFAETILLNEHFNASHEKKLISIAELSLKDLNLHNRATLPGIRNCIKEFGLSECPLETGPYIRLHYKNQKEFKTTENVKNESPPGAIVIFSKPIIEEDDFPKGFYLRSIDGVLWLRGYCCSMDYHWAPETRFIFQIKEE